MILQIFGDSPIGNLIQGIRSLVNPEGVKREQLLTEIEQNPVLGQQIAESRRRQFMDVNEVADAEQDLGGPLLASLGLNPDNMDNRVFLDQLAVRFPSSREETARGLLATPEAGEELAGAVRSETRATGAGADASVVAENNRRRLEEARGQIGDPEALAIQQQRLREQQVESGELTLASQALGLEEQEQQFAFWDDYNQWLEANPRFRGLASVALKNPNFLRQLQFWEELSLREKLALLRQNQEGQEDMLKVLGLSLGIIKDLQGIRENTLEVTEGEADVSVKRSSAAIDRSAQRILESFGFPVDPTIVDVEDPLFGGPKTTATTVSPARGEPLGGREPTGLRDVEAAGPQRQMMEAGKQFLLEKVRTEGIDATMSEIFSNPDQDVQDFIDAMRTDGQWNDFLKTLQFESKESKQERVRRQLENLGAPGAL